MMLTNAAARCSLGGGYHHASRPCQHHPPFCHRSECQRVCRLGWVRCILTIYYMLKHIHITDAPRRKIYMSFQQCNAQCHSSITSMQGETSSRLSTLNAISLGKGKPWYLSWSRQLIALVQVQRRRRSIAAQTRQRTRSHGFASSTTHGHSWSGQRPAWSTKHLCTW